MRRDPQRPERKTQTALLISDLEPPDRAVAAELIILMLDATAHDYSGEKAAETLVVIKDFLADAIRLYQTMTGTTWK